MNVKAEKTETVHRNQNMSVNIVNVVGHFKKKSLWRLTFAVRLVAIRANARRCLMQFSTSEVAA